MQQTRETLSQYWHALNGLAAPCDFSEITSTFVLDMFILHMTYKKVQEKLCPEPKEPEQALEFAIAFEEGIKRQKSYGITAETSKTSVKSEPIFAEERSNQRECFRCGESNFTMEHIKNCKAANYKCKHCKIVAHLETCCNRKFPQRHKEMMKRLKSRDNQMRRVNYIDEEESEEEESSHEEEQLVLRVDGKGHKPFYMEGLMCGKRFKAIIDTGSPVSIFTERDLQQIIGERKVVVRDMIEDEHYVDYNKRPLKLLGYQFVRLEVAGVTVSKARVLVAPNSGKSIVGRDWLIALRYQIKQPTESGECERINQAVISDQSVNNIKCERTTQVENCDKPINSANPEEKISPEVQQFIEEFPNLVERKGRVKIEIKINMKNDAKISQQKGRRVPIQLQEQVDNEVKKLPEEGHIERVEKIQDDVFIQPTFITVKKTSQSKLRTRAKRINS